MHESTCSRPTVGECVNLQFYNSKCSYLLSLVDFLEEQLWFFSLSLLFVHHATIFLSNRVTIFFYQKYVFFYIHYNSQKQLV